jgi:hypothetical protein
MPALQIIAILIDLADYILLCKAKTLIWKLSKSEAEKINVPSRHQEFFFYSVSKIQDLNKFNDFMRQYYAWNSCKDFVYTDSESNLLILLNTMVPSHIYYWLIFDND